MYPFSLQRVYLQPGIYLLTLPELLCEYTLRNPTGTIERQREETISLYKLYFNTLLGNVRLHHQAAFSTSVFNIPAQILDHLTLILLIQVIRRRSTCHLRFKLQRHQARNL